MRLTTDRDMVCCCSIQLAIDVQLPHSFGGLGSKAIYIGESKRSKLSGIRICCIVYQTVSCHRLKRVDSSAKQTRRAAS